MDKNRGLIIATILLFIFGTGTFVFANPSEEDYQNYATDKTGNGQNTTKKEEKENQVSTEQNETNQPVQGTEENENSEKIPNINTNPENNGVVNTTNRPNNNQNAGTGNGANNNNTNNSNNENNSGNNNEENNNSQNPSQPGGNEGGNQGSDNKPPVDTGNENNPDDNEEKPEEPKYEPFVFTPNGTFSSEVIFINDPNYDHMDVYNSASYKTTTIYENTYKINVKNIMYYFIVYYKDGTKNDFVMFHKEATN